MVPTELKGKILKVLFGLHLAIFSLNWFPVVIIINALLETLYGPFSCQYDS